jgi:hypothetical protein
MGGILKRNSVVTAIRRTTRSSKTPRRADQPVVEQPPCAICQEPVGVPSPDGITEGWSTLSCGHTFGSVCIKKWLGMIDRPCCPMCREDLAHSCGHAVLPTVVNVNVTVNNQDQDHKQREQKPQHQQQQQQQQHPRRDGERWKPQRRAARDDARKSACGFCSMSPQMRTRLRTRILIKMIRLVLKGTRQRRHVQSMDNWQRGQAVLRQQEVREEWEDWWDMQEPRTDREREADAASTSAATSRASLPEDAGTNAAAEAEAEAEAAGGRVDGGEGAVTVVTTTTAVFSLGRTLSNAAPTGSSGRAASM